MTGIDTILRLATRFTLVYLFLITAVLLLGKAVTA